MDFGWFMLGFPILHLKGTRTMMFQLSGFYYNSGPFDLKPQQFGPGNAMLPLRSMRENPLEFRGSGFRVYLPVGPISLCLVLGSFWNCIIPKREPFLFLGYWRSQNMWARIRMPLIIWGICRIYTLVHVESLDILLTSHPWTLCPMQRVRSNTWHG